MSILWTVIESAPNSIDGALGLWRTDYFFSLFRQCSRIYFIRADMKCSYCMQYITVSFTLVNILVQFHWTGKQSPCSSLKSKSFSVQFKIQKKISSVSDGRAIYARIRPLEFRQFCTFVCVNDLSTGTLDPCVSVLFSFSPFSVCV